MHLPVIDDTLKAAQQDILSNTVNTPLASPLYRVNSSQPKATSMTHADLLCSIGFLKQVTYESTCLIWGSAISLFNGFLAVQK